MLLFYCLKRLIKNKMHIYAEMCEIGDLCLIDIEEKSILLGAIGGYFCGGGAVTSKHNWSGQNTE